jgi:oligopeptide/dipeptide ABC transporter ATP-binding protein
MANAPATLELRDLRVLLGGQRRLLRKPVPPVRAVGGVSLSVRQGEILGLVGESGCGKTTLGRTVLGLQRESGGEVRLDGKLVSGLPSKRARVVRNDIHYVHQDAAAALDPWWSIGRTLEEGLCIHGIRNTDERRERVDEMLAAVGLDGSARPRYPHEFSGGQLRRVALARILVLKPRFPDSRRADLRSRHVGAGDGAQSAARAETASRTHLPLHLARSLGGGAVLRSGGDHVSRADRRTGADPRDFCLAAAPLHPGSAVGGAGLAPGPKRAERLAQGEPPSAAHLPQGCVFSSRCPHAEPACSTTEPTLEDAAFGHQVACRRWQELRPEACAA